MKPIFFSAVLATTASLAFADVSVSFSEGAPKDRFTFTNIGDCALPALTLALDLSGSAGKLVFDITDQGAGVQVFQPFELVAGKDHVTKISATKDGDKTVALNVSGLAKGDSVAFTIDVDDTLGQREITVNEQEISGTVASVSINGKQTAASFVGTTATIQTDCNS